MTTDPSPCFDEAHLTPAGATSPFLPGTQIQFAWDATSLSLFRTCPRLYQYTILDGWSGRHDNIHLIFGGEYHSTLEDFDHAIAQGIPRDEALHGVVKAMVQRIWDWPDDETTKAGKYKNRHTLVGLVVDYLDHFNPDPAETYIKSDGTPAVELSFRFELDWGPEAGIEYDMIGDYEVPGGTARMPVRQNQPYLLCGHLDRVVTFNQQLFILDRKTTTTTLGDYYFHGFSPDTQMSLYTLAGKIILDAPIRGVIIDAAQIRLEEPNAFARGFTYRTEGQLEEWLDDIRSTLALAETYAVNGHWPMNDKACSMYGGCKFRGICSKDPHVRQAFLNTDFVKLPIEARWNPMKAR